MQFFSFNKELPKKISDIPPEFFSAVTTMSHEISNVSAPDSIEHAAVPSPPPPASLVSEHGANPFLGEKPTVESQVSTPVRGEGLKGSNPFLPETKINPAVQAIQNDQISFKDETSFESKKKRAMRLFLYIGGGIVFAALLVIGVLYAVKNNVFSRSSTEVSQSVALEGQVQATDENTTESMPFALDKPNYISINTETATPQDIKKSFNQSAERMISARMVAPVEFLITDQNNNPIAFSRFAYIEKFEIDTGLLALVEESFSCFVYNDAGQARMGLILTFRDPVLAGQIIAKKEGTLPYAFRTLLYDNATTLSRTAVFRSGKYNTQAVRFVNIDSTRNFSFDYALQGKRFILGASKDTLRAVIDRSISR